MKRNLRERFELPFAATDFDDCRIARLEPAAAAYPYALADSVGGCDAGEMFRRARVETRPGNVLLTGKGRCLDLKHQVGRPGKTIIEEDGNLELHREITHGQSFSGAPQQIWWRASKCKDAHIASRRYGGTRAPRINNRTEPA